MIEGRREEIPATPLAWYYGSKQEAENATNGDALTEARPSEFSDEWLIIIW
jgi:hypothetical protein